MKGFIHKVGSNYVLKAGKLFGGQISLDEEDMERNVDINMPFARGYKYNIKFHVPQDYDVFGEELFDFDVDN